MDWFLVWHAIARSWSGVGQKLVSSLVSSWSEVGQQLVISWYDFLQKLVIWCSYEFIFNVL